MSTKTRLNRRNLLDTPSNHHPESDDASAPDTPGDDSSSKTYKRTRDRPIPLNIEEPFILKDYIIKCALYPLWVLWLCTFSFFSFFLKLDFIILYHSHQFINFTLRRNDYKKLSSFQIGKFITLFILIAVLIAAIFIRESGSDESEYEKVQYIQLIDEKFKEIMAHIEKNIHSNHPNDHQSHKYVDDKIKVIQNSMEDIKNQFKSIQHEKISDTLKQLQHDMTAVNEKTKTIENKIQPIDLNELFKSLNDSLQAEVIKIVQEYIEKNTKHEEPRQEIPSSDITRLIKEAFKTYDADRIAKRDYANRKYGSTILDYHVPSKWSSLMKSNQGILSSIIELLPFSRLSNPEDAIDSDVSAGSCWSFPGEKANLTVHLYKKIIPTEFTIEHIDEAIASNINSSPKDVNVYGINEHGKEVLLAKYRYRIKTNSDESNIQTFKTMKQEDVYYEKIKLEIVSNYGHEYTCLYRFRVHGKE